jgi:hypothetical protein
MNLMLKKFLTSLFQRPATTAGHDGHPFIALARAEMMDQHKLHAETWQLGKEQGWSADIGVGVVVFKFANGITGTTHFQAIGSYDEKDASFLWGWAHPSVPLALSSHASLSKHWGVENKLASFSTKVVKCTLDEAWDFAAVTSKLAGSHGVYRGHAGSKYIFMTIGEIHVDNNTIIPHWAAVAKT